ncbi:MAG: HIT domain-containing protein [Candidatus Levybacteria bacterium]|nr:HIT domain-containing protein [Candidatus Levybacteria bacterium]
MDDCIFCKIANKEIPKEFTYEDEEVMVFPDLHPAKPIHLLIAPKKHIADFLDVDDPALMGRLWQTAQRMAKTQGLTGKGFRILVNSGGAQIVPHLHLHLMGPFGKAVKD